MNERGTDDDSTATTAVIGVRTRGSDRVRWAKWAGGQPMAPGDWVRFADTGELGRVIAGPGKVIGIPQNASLPRMIPVISSVVSADAEVPSAVRTGWGRIGHRHWTSGEGLIEEQGSAESARYREAKTGMPALGSRFETDRGSGIVVQSDVFEGTIAVRLDNSSEVVEIRHRPPRPRGMTASAEPKGSKESQR